MLSLFALTHVVGAPITEPWLPMHSYTVSGAAVDTSPDPLVQYRWNEGVDTVPLQYYRSQAVSAKSVPEGAFIGLESVATGNVNVTCMGPGWLVLDFGTERAGWMEFTSQDMRVVSVLASISEFAQPWLNPTKTMQPVAYDNGVYRLETNTPELYEGVSYGWVMQSPDAAFKPWSITNLTVAAQIKPFNYTGSFTSSDKVLEEIWYTGAYSSRLNMNTNYFSSILMDRGDRVAIQGDGHPTMAAALVAFESSYELVAVMLNSTDSSNHTVVDQTILAYPVYWTMSVNDWLWQSGNVSGYLHFKKDIAKIIDARAQNFLTSNLVWMGWDDRIDNGWCGNPCNREATLGLAALVVKAARDFSKGLLHAGDTAGAQQYETLAANLTATLRSTSPHGKPWYTEYGVHALANAVNGDVATPEEYDAIFTQSFNDSTQICSWSPFNSYYILQALGNMGKKDYAASMMKLCWGGILKLGKGCFWELFSPEWSSFMTYGGKAPTRPSYCHPWSNGPTHYLSWMHAGIRALTPGYSQYLFVPALVPSAPSTEATVGTPHGPISVSTERVGQTWEMRVSAQTGGVLAVPRTQYDCTLHSVHLNGVPHTSTKLAASTLSAHEVASHATYKLNAGTHTMTVTYQGGACGVAQQATPQGVTGVPHIPPFPVPSYPSKSGLDNTTGGSWIGKYGSAGYALYAFNEGAEDVISMPSWANVSFFRYNPASTKVVEGVGANASFLQDPSNPVTRRLGIVGKLDGSDGNQGTVIDLAVEPGMRFKASIYIATGWGNSSAIRTMDLKGNVIAPTPLIENPTGGVYWSVTPNAAEGGVRFRVMGTEASQWLSAVFLDTVTE